MSAAITRNGIIRWLFADRKTGRLVVVQFPNAPLWLFIVATAIRLILRPSGTVGTVVSLVATIALVIWAVIEIGWGVNPFRRGLGAVVLIGEAVMGAMTLLS